MVFYDCDDESQFEELEARFTEDDLLARNLLQAFSPDEPYEAVNRGFKALVPPLQGGPTERSEVEGGS
jgi:hypothetical protein